MVVKTLPIPSTLSPGNNAVSARRTLKLSQSVSCPPTDRSGKSERQRLPDAADLRQMCIITRTDLNRIYENLDRRQRDKDAVREELERKKDLADRSAQRTKDWTNTLAGARERKLEMRKIREQEEEERKKLLDIEEERLASERRREHIDKAKQLQYYDTDRVRTFHGALLLTEVLKERDLQIEMKQRIAQMRHTDDHEELQRLQNAQIQSDQAEREKLEKKLKDRTNLAQFQLAQIDQRKHQLMESRERESQEGVEYRRLAEQAEREHLERERHKMLAQKNVRTMYDKAVDDRNKVKQMEEQIDQEEDEELRIYAEAKKKIARLRRAKEVQAHQEKQDARDQMIGYLGSLQKRAEADYDTQIFRARAEREAKERRDEQDKLEKQQKMQESINQHRMNTMKRRELERGKEEREDAGIHAKKADADRLFQLYQAEKAKQRQRDAHTVSDFHLKQAQERKDRRQELKSIELEELQHERQLNEHERQQFQEYTGRVITHMRDNGRNTYALERVVGDEMKRFDQVNPSLKKLDNSPQTTRREKPVGPERRSIDQTKKHLGFEWEIPGK